MLSLCLWFVAGCSRVPVPEAPVYSAGDEATVVRMHKLHSVDLGLLPLLQVQLGGKTSFWVLDTGSSHNLISPSLAKALQLRRVSSSVVATVGGRKLTQHYRLPALKIGRLSLEGQSASAVDLSGLHSQRYQVAGILGMPALNNLLLELDYKQGTIHLAAGDTFNPLQESGSVIPFRLEGGVPVARLPVFAGRMGDFILDTGNATGVLLLPSYVRQDIHQGLSFVQVEDLGGAIPTRLATLSKLRLGLRNFYSVPAFLPVNSQRLAQVDGSLGNTLWSQQRILFDFQQQQLFLEHHRQPVVFPGGFGFLLAHNNTIEVVLDNSPAQKAGLQPGDQIVALDGESLVTGEHDGAEQIWQYLLTREQVELEVLKPQQQGSRAVTVQLRRGAYLEVLE